MSYRCQWREWRGHLKVPAAGEVRFEDGHDSLTVAGKVRELLAGEHPPCWVYIERTDVQFKGSSTERPKARTKETKKK